MAATIFNAAAEHLVPLTLANTLGALGANTDKVFHPHNEWYTQVARVGSVAMQCITAAAVIYSQALPDMAKAIASVALGFTAFMWLESNDTFVAPAAVKTLNLGYNVLAIGTALASATINPVLLGVNVVCLAMNAIDYHAHLTAPATV